MITPDPPAQFIALDVGGTAIKGGIFAVGNAIESMHRWHTPREDGPEAVIESVLKAIDELVERSVTPKAIGLVVPGIVNEQSGTALFSENIGWKDVPFRQLLADRTGLPVGFGHDVRAGGLAEREMGAAQNVDNVLFMPIGTGISGAMYIDGQLKSDKYAGEIGHLDVGSGELCACGATGCLETVATGPSIARRYNAITGDSVSGAKPVVERMIQGDSAAATVWADAVEALAHALASYVSLLSPELVVLGGGVSTAGALLLDPLRIALSRKLVWQPHPRVVQAALGDNAACIGAAILASAAWNSVESPAKIPVSPGS